MTMCRNITKNIAFKVMTRRVVGPSSRFISKNKIKGKKKEKEEEDINKVVIGTTAKHRKILTSGRVVGNNHNKYEWMRRRRKKYKRDNYGNIEGENKYQDDNPFEALRENQENDKEGEDYDNNEKENIKDW